MTGSGMRLAPARLTALRRAALGLLTCAAAAAGAAAGGYATPDDRSAGEAAPPLTVQADGMTLTLPADWSSARLSTPVPGMERALAVRSGTSDMALAILPPQTFRLLPRELVARADDLRARRPVSAGRGQMAAYSLWLPDGLAATVLATPTTKGILTLACRSELGASWAADDCATAAARVRLDADSAWVPLRPDVALRLGLPDILAALDRSRVPERAALAATRSPQRRATAAARVAAAYRRASGAAALLAGPGSRAVPRELERLAGAYAALGRATAARVSHPASRAAARIDAGERRLARRLAQLGA